jgi:hypothetical protein
LRALGGGEGEALRDVQAVADIDSVGVECDRECRGRGEDQAETGVGRSLGAERAGAEEDGDRVRNADLPRCKERGGAGEQALAGARIV